MQVMKSFHDKGVKHVVLTSLSLPRYNNELVLLASEKGRLFFFFFSTARVQGDI